jgi:hypothetical protein
MPNRLVAGLVVGGGLAALIAGRKTVMSITGKAFDWTKAQAFQAALPLELRRWAAQLLTSAKKYDVDPWTLAGIMYRESLGGAALSPKNDAGGTGDFIARPAGRTWAQPDGSRYVVGASGMPEDGLGWGRGLMQIDWAVHHQWFKRVGSAWRDPQVNVDKGAELLKERVQFFTAGPGKPVMVDVWRITNGLPQYRIQGWAAKYPSALMPRIPTGAKQVGPFADPRPLKGSAVYEAAVASYNAGQGGVLQALALGLPAEAPTTGQDYVSWFLSRIGTWSRGF